MAAVRETKLPGVGVKLEFTTDEGRNVGVLVHRDGRRDILVYDRDDPDACSSRLELTPADTRTMSELLGGSTVTETVSAVQQQIEGLAIEWIEIPATSQTIGTTIGDGQFRTKTGSSIVAVIRRGDTTPAPGPEFEFAGGDVAVAVGTVEGLATLRDVIRH
jgi:TrkA domain protein